MSDKEKGMAEPQSQYPNLDPLVSSVLMGDRKWHKVMNRSFAVNQQGSFIFEEHTGDMVIGPVTALGGMRINKEDYAKLQDIVAKSKEKEAGNAAND